MSRPTWVKWSWLILLVAIVGLSLDYHWRRLPTTAAGYFARGRADYLLGEYEPAIDNFTRSIELDPGEAEAYIWRGEAHAKLKDFDRAMPDLEKALVLRPDYAKSHAAMADGKAAAWDAQGAIEEYSRAIELEPDYGRCYLERGKMLYDVRRFNEAAADFRRAAGLMIGENRVTAHLMLWAAAARGGDPAGANAELSKTLSIGALKTNRFWNAVHFLTGKLDEHAYVAAAVAETSEGDEQDDAEAYFLAAAKRIAAGDRTGALPWLRLALETEDEASYAYERARVEASNLLMGFQPVRNPDGALGVASVVAGGPAEAAGLTPGAVITAIDTAQAGQDALVGVLATAGPDATLTVQIAGRGPVSIRLGSSAPTR